MVACWNTDFTHCTHLLSIFTPALHCPDGLFRSWTLLLDLSLNCIEGYYHYKVALCRQVWLMWCAPQATPVHMVPFRVLCGVRTWLQHCWWFRCTLVFVQLFALGHWVTVKCDVDVLSWLNVETLKRAPTPLFGRLVMYFAHGRSFARLQYVCLVS